jgi:3-deoxy-D-manno-octulosonic-acid transferase
VIFGPHWQESRDAGRLVAAGGAASASSAEALGRLWHGWLENDDARAAMGARALAVVESERGASARSAALLDQFA